MHYIPFNKSYDRGPFQTDLTHIETWIENEYRLNGIEDHKKEWQWIHPYNDIWAIVGILINNAQIATLFKLKFSL